MVTEVGNVSQNYGYPRLGGNRESKERADPFRGVLEAGTARQTSARDGKAWGFANKRAVRVADLEIGKVETLELRRL